MADHGGKRKGAGRKPGAASQKTREIAERAMQDGITPLEVMLEAMRDSYNKGELKDAATIAKDCAPYVHPRLSSVEMKADIRAELEKYTDDAIDAEIKRLAAEACVVVAAAGAGEAQEG